MSKQEKEKKAITKEELKDMQVIDSEGKNVGTVADIGFMVGDVGWSLIVKTKKGETKEIPYNEIQAAGDFIILKPPATQPQAMTSQQAAPAQKTYPCPFCGAPMKYVYEQKQWYCEKENRYPYK